MDEEARRYQMTARHHLKMARIYESMGRTADVKSAREAAAACVMSMGLAMSVEPDKEMRGEAAYARATR